MQQLHTQMRFQLLDQDGHRSLGHVQAIGRAGEAAQLDDAGKYTHGIETIH